MENKRISQWGTQMSLREIVEAYKRLGYTPGVEYEDYAYLEKKRGSRVCRVHLREDKGVIVENIYAETPGAVRDITLAYRDGEREKALAEYKKHIPKTPRAMQLAYLLVDYIHGDGARVYMNLKHRLVKGIIAVQVIDTKTEKHASIWWDGELAPYLRSLFSTRRDKIEGIPADKVSQILRKISAHLTRARKKEVELYS